jgi:hypothetical protein
VLFRKKFIPLQTLASFEQKQELSGKDKQQNQIKLYNRMQIPAQ